MTEILLTYLVGSGFAFEYFIFLYTAHVYGSPWEGGGVASFATVSGLRHKARRVPGGPGAVADGAAALLLEC